MIKRKRGETTEQFFWRNVDKTPGHGPKGDCWLWTAGKTSAGYGQIGVSGKHEYAHRYAWFLATGVWPKQLVCHTCDTPACVKHEHFFEGSRADNQADMKRKGRGVGPHFQGIAHPMAVLNDEQVLDIRRRCDQGEKIRDVASLFGIAHGTVQFIRARKTWKHLPEREVSIGR